MESSILSAEINFTGILTSMKMITPSLQYVKIVSMIKCENCCVEKLN